MKKIHLLTIATLITILSGCVTTSPPPTWEPTTKIRETEYDHYLEKGTGSLTGQAFLTQRGGGVVKAAGRTVTLDPATSTGNEWWGKSGKVYEHRMLTPPSPGFAKARRKAIADADGKFKFTDLPAGKYYVRTEVTWDVVYHGVQGGLVGQVVEINEDETTEVILNQYAN